MTRGIRLLKKWFVEHGYMGDKWDKIEWLVACVIIFCCWVGDIYLWVKYLVGDMPYWGNAFVAFILCAFVTVYLIYIKKDFDL